MKRITATMVEPLLIPYREASSMTMNRSSFLTFSSTTICLLLMVVFASTAMIPRSSAKDEETKLLRHVVQFKFKDSSSKEDVQKVVDAFRGLKGKIPEVASFEYGINNSPEKLNDGFTHAFLITFKSEDDRGVYLTHKAHMEFVDVLKPHLDKVQVIDYWAAQ